MAALDVLAKVYGRMVPERRAEGTELYVRALRDGTLSFADFIQLLAFEGRVFSVNFGTIATQLTFLVQAANRPDFWVRVPSGTTILPLACTVALGAFAGTVTTISLRTAQNDIGNGTSSAASIGPLSLRTDTPITSNCTARQLATADTTAETNPLEIWKRVIPAANVAGNDATGSVTIRREEIGYPVLIGPASFEGFVWATTTQATGYAVMIYAELPSSFFI